MMNEEQEARQIRQDLLELRAFGLEESTEGIHELIVRGDYLSAGFALDRVLSSAGHLLSDIDEIAEENLMPRGRNWHNGANAPGKVDRLNVLTYALLGSFTALAWAIIGWAVIEAFPFLPWVTIGEGAAILIALSFVVVILLADRSTR